MRIVGYVVLSSMGPIAYLSLAYIIASTLPQSASTAGADVAEPDLQDGVAARSFWVMSFQLVWAGRGVDFFEQLPGMPLLSTFVPLQSLPLTYPVSQTIRMPRRQLKVDLRLLPTSLPVSPAKPIGMPSEYTLRR